MPQENVNKKPNRKFHIKSLLPSTQNSFLTILLIISLLMNGGLVPLTRRGFFCDDTSIRYPIRPDTVSFPVLLIFALFLPLIVISFLEKKLCSIMRCTRHKQAPRRNSDPLGSDIDQVEEFIPSEISDQVKRRAKINDCESNLMTAGPSSSTLHGDHDTPESADCVKTSDLRARRFSRGLSDKQMFMFGIIATAFLTGLTKTTSGRMRPHFMARCQPDIDCTSPDNLYRYIDNFKCTEPSMRPRDYNYITTSFPSGHASLIFYSMFYLIFYIDFTISAILKFKTAMGLRVLRFSPLVIHSTYVSMISLAIYISLTRVSDYHHHPVDVLTGALLGSVIAIIMSKYLLTQRFASLASSSPIKVDA